MRTARKVPVMHACGHDMNMTCVLGAAKVLAELKAQWRGTLVVIGQPAEEQVAARGDAGRRPFQTVSTARFLPALHDDAELAAGTVGYTPGYALANVDSVTLPSME